jgi:hypothetical protein
LPDQKGEVIPPFIHHADRKCCEFRAIRFEQTSNRRSVGVDFGRRMTQEGYPHVMPKGAKFSYA